MNRELPDSLIPALRMLRRAFPNGAKASEYYRLLAALYDIMSDRNLALMVAYFTCKSYSEVYNDIAKVFSTHRPTSQEVSSIVQELAPYGYEEWYQPRNPPKRA